MAAAACKVILCGCDNVSASEQLAEFAMTVQSGAVPMTPEIEVALNQAAAALDEATGTLRKVNKVVMDAAFG